MEQQELKKRLHQEFSLFLTTLGIVYGKNDLYFGTLSGALSYNAAESMALVISMCEPENQEDAKQKLLDSFHKALDTAIEEFNEARTGNEIERSIIDAWEKPLDEDNN